MLTGIRHARTDIVAVIDCDGTYDPLQLRALVPLLGPGVDMVTASPYHPDGEVLNLPAYRLILSKDCPSSTVSSTRTSSPLYRVLSRLSQGVPSPTWCCGTSVSSASPRF